MTDLRAGREIISSGSLRFLLERGIPAELATPLQWVVAEESESGESEQAESEGGESEQADSEVSRRNNLVSVPSSAAPRARVRVYIRRG